MGISEGFKCQTSQAAYNGPKQQCRYFSFSVLFQTKSSLVWKSYTQKKRTILQTNSSLVWNEKMILQDADSKPSSDWFRVGQKKLGWARKIYTDGVSDNYQV